MAAGVARDTELLDQTVERILLVRERLERRVLHPIEKRDERLIARHRAPERDRVDEEPDLPFEIRMIAAGGGVSDDDVALARVAVEQRRSRRR